LTSVEITLNGEARFVSEGLTVAELIAQLELQPKFVAVERNLQVVPQAQHTNCQLAPGDRIEIVTLVGGG
jgi:thiamine biosynthesis protein ThiS